MLPIHGEVSDHEGRDNVVTVVITKHDKPSAARRNGNMIDGRNPQLSTSGQVNRERHERSRMSEFMNVGNHLTLGYADDHPHARHLKRREKRFSVASVPRGQLNQSHVTQPASD
jgi:hypothetical protein